MLNNRDVELMYELVTEGFVAEPYASALTRIKTALAELGTTPNTGSAEIALRLEELVPHIKGGLGSNMAGYIVQVINAVVAQLRAGA